MRHRVLTVIAGLLGLTLCLAVGGGVRAAGSLQEADRLYAEKSYAAALPIYQEILAQNRAGDRGTEIEYRVAVSLGRARKWDDALAATGTFVAQHPTGIWGARGWHWQGQLLVVLPHHGYRVGKRVYRGDDYPRVGTAEKPEYVYLEREDQDNARAAFEKAKALYEGLGSRYATEEADLSFDLARVLARKDNLGLVRALMELEKEKRPGLALRYGPADPEELKRVRGHDWTLKAVRRDDPARPLPQRILTLYLQIERLEAKRAPESRLARALYLKNYQEQMREYLRAYDEKKKEWVNLPYPYDQEDPIAVVRSIPERFPKSALAPQAQLLVGGWLEAKAQFVAALEAYRQIPKRWPDSKWVTDARNRIQAITWPVLQLRGATVAPGAKVAVAASSRNVKTVSLAAYKVQLEKLLLNPAVLNARRPEWADFEAGFGAALNPVWRKGGKQVASWTLTTKDKGDHAFLREETPAPVTETGAYIVEATSGESHAATIVIITDLAVVTKTDQDHSLAYVCDARRGGPVQGAQVITREALYNNSTHTWDITSSRGKADGEGLFSKDLMPGRQQWEQRRIQTLAWVGDRYAITRDDWHSVPRGAGRTEYRGYLITDRPVYRPGQMVSFRAVLMAHTQNQSGELVGAWQVAKDQPFEVVVTDARGGEVLKRAYTSNEFGTFNGGFTLGAEPPLGVYNISVRQTAADLGVYSLDGNQFRVEEYKKPEFEVKVTPGAEQLRVGGTVTARLEARYYFGSPVVASKVKYRVFRAPCYPSYHFPSRYDWLAGDWTQGRYYRRSHGEGEVVKEGEGTTDAQGVLEITFAAEAGGRWPEAKAYTFTVKAEVTDPSRRVIEGSGEVRASAQQYFAFLHLQRGFYQEGDLIEVEVATRDVMDRPVAVAGVLHIDRVVKGAAPKDVIDAHFGDLPVQTDKEGRAFIRWTVPEAGWYRFQYEGTDQWKQTVTGNVYTWVHGPELARRKMHFSGIELIPEKRTYDEGDVCRLLIVSSQPDATVLLTEESGRLISHRWVVRIQGKSRVLEIPIHRGLVPNFQFSAVGIYEWQGYSAATEVFVPAGKQFLNISVTSDRATYRPGEEATFTLKATDSAGRPVRTEISLGVVDASLYYIQPDFASDPRSFFYGDRRHANIGQNWSLREYLGGSSDNERQQTAYKVHEFVMPENMGQLQTWPPDLLGWDWFTQHGLVVDRFGRRGDAGDYAMFGDERAAMEQYVTRASGPAPALAAADGWGFAGVSGGGGARGGVARKAAPGAAPGAPLAEAAVRTRFADTAYWSPALVTGADGTATVKVTMPENLTTWRATARAVTAQAQVGQATGETITRKNLIVRLQAPRFFMERDVVVLSANVHNYLATDKRAKVTLRLDGGTLELVKEVPADLALKSPATEMELWVDVPKDGERRVDWVVRVLRSGTAAVRMTAQTDEESDATELSFPALVHGAEKQVVQSGVMRDVKGTERATVTLALPSERRRGATELNVQLTPSLAAVTLDALPYLADYPYGCIEQTMSRFLPSAVVARTLKDLGLDLSELQKRAAAYADEREKGTQAQPDSGYTYPKGMPGSVNAPELARRMYLRRPAGPIFDPGKLEEMVRDGLARVYSQQHADGGWGWWQSDISDPYMTAYVVSGLFTAQQAGYEVKGDVLDRGFQFLLADLPEEDNLHRMAYLASVVTLRPVDDKVKAVVSDGLYRNRERLTAYSQALLALALVQVGEADKARVVVDNLRNTAHIDAENGTANWPGVTRWWWHWWDSPMETNAAVLRAYLAVYPDGELAPMMVKWMVNNRRGNHWESTKETALAVQALAEYIRLKNELAPDYTITVDLDGKVQRTYRVTRENALFFDNRFIVGDDLLGDGPQTVTVTVKGTGTLYYSAFLRYFSLEEDLKGAGNEIFVQRRYFKLTPRLVDKEQGTRKWQELTYDRAELPSGAAVKSGDLLEVELVLEAKNDYEYVVFEDMKPAGCEPVALRSGAGEGAGVYSHMELRDEKVAFFISHLPQGTRAVRYQVRAEIPGAFHTLPTNGYAMYAPDVRCLGDEWRVGIADQ